jgi:hypothetical protein
LRSAGRARSARDDLTRTCSKSPHVDGGNPAAFLEKRGNTEFPCGGGLVVVIDFLSEFLIQHGRTKEFRTLLPLMFG